jgi:hypothetical protein
LISITRPGGNGFLYDTSVEIATRESGTMWDPGVSQVKRTNLYKINTHCQFYSLLSTISVVDAVDDTEEDTNS